MRTKFDIYVVDTRSGKEIQHILTKPLYSQFRAAVFCQYMERFSRYLERHPYCRLIISPSVDVETGELFNIKPILKPCNYGKEN